MLAPPPEGRRPLLQGILDPPLTEIIINVLFLKGHKMFYCVAKNLCERFMLRYFNTFVISL